MRPHAMRLETSLSDLFISLVAEYDLVCPIDFCTHARLEVSRGIVSRPPEHSEGCFLTLHRLRI